MRSKDERIEPQNYSTSEAAQRLGLSVVTIRRRVLAGDIRAWRLGRGWRIPAGEIERIETGAPR